MSRIEWTERHGSGGHGVIGEDGRVGGIRLFSAGYAKAGQYYLETTLPVVAPKWVHKTHQSTEAAKAAAEHVLAAFVRQIGAEFVTTPAPEDWPTAARGSLAAFQAKAPQ